MGKTFINRRNLPVPTVTDVITNGTSDTTHLSLLDNRSSTGPERSLNDEDGSTITVTRTNLFDEEKDTVSTSGYVLNVVDEDKGRPVRERSDWIIDKIFTLSSRPMALATILGGSIIVFYIYRSVKKDNFSNRPGDRSIFLWIDAALGLVLALSVFVVVRNVIT